MIMIGSPAGIFSARVRVRVSARAQHALRARTGVMPALRSASAHEQEEKLLLLSLRAPRARSRLTRVFDKESALARDCVTPDLHCSHVSGSASRSRQQKHKS
jgi:hypothetical protein